MRPGWAILLLVAVIGCGGGGFFQEYEYEEELYLALDGSATLYVNSSLEALNALRGTRLDTQGSAGFPQTELRRYFDSPATRLTRLNSSRRNNRTYVHARLDVDDVRRLGATEPFGWSAYYFDEEGELLVYRQKVGPGSTAAEAGTTNPAIPRASEGDGGGEELVAFRIHAPSRIEYHTAGQGNLRRGNILVWEQPLSARLRGEPIEIEVRMQRTSILKQTLWLFAAAGLIVAALFGLVIVWLLRGQRAAEERPSRWNPPRT